MLGFAPDLGIDLGTANVLIFQKGRGIVLREPSVVAVHKYTRELRAAGVDARQMLGRTPTTITALRPIHSGVIADYTVTEQMLREFIHKVVGKHCLFRPRIIVCVPSGVTSVERRAVLDATKSAGAKEVYPIEEPMAAAIGAGLNIGDPQGNMIVDIGGGTTDIAVVSLGGIVKSDSVRIGGDRFDEAINRHIKREYNMIIGDQTAEDVKIEIGSAFPLDEELTYEIKGRDMVNGMPKDVVLTSGEIREALAEPLAHLVDSAKHVLEQTPPELATDIVENGIWITGGCAMLRGIDQLLQHETGIPAHIAEDPLSCVALGAGKALDHIEMLDQTHFAYAGLETY